MSTTHKRGPGKDIYVKGALVMHTLAALIGDDAFFVACAGWCTAAPIQPGQLQPRYGTTREFIAIVNEATGRDLNWFFDVYLYQAELPELSHASEGKLTLHWKTAATSRSRCRSRCGSATNY